VRFDSEHIDALAAKFVLQPERFDVVVGSNLFGDILSDLAAAVAGSIGIAPSANLDPTRQFPSMFEPVHGSAPDIAGQGVANPVGAVWSAALMLQHLGHPAAAVDVVAAMEAALAKPETRTADLGGTANTAEVTTALVAHIRGR
jgi:tartrate dehydrogenase/decarboxylase / D-malate dehydrogenase